MTARLGSVFTKQGATLERAGSWSLDVALVTPINQIY